MSAHRHRKEFTLSTGVLAFALICTFWTSTVVSELFGSAATVAAVKGRFSRGMLALIPAMAAVGGTGFRLGGKSKAPLVVGETPPDAGDRAERHPDPRAVGVLPRRTRRRRPVPYVQAVVATPEPWGLRWAFKGDDHTGLDARRCHRRVDRLKRDELNSCGSGPVLRRG